MANADLITSWHIALDDTQFYYWDNENTNGGRDGKSWATAYRDGEGTPGQGQANFIKATDTPYRMTLNNVNMSNTPIWCDCTGTGFERSKKKADFRASATFSFSTYDGPNNIYNASVPDVLTGARTGAYGYDYPGHYLFAETLNYAGAWGVWQVVTIGQDETLTPLTRVLNMNDLVHGTWYWSAGTLYVKWDNLFNQSSFEVIQKAKTIELWTDSIPTDGRRSSVFGIKSRFGLFGHHNGNCKGFRIVDSDFSRNAIDGVAIIAQNTLAKSDSLYTQVYRCEIHHNYRDGLTNYVTPAGAMARGSIGYHDLCADFNYIHSNGGAGIFLHRMGRWNVTDNIQSSSYPFRIGNNTITGNGRGIVLTDERMAEVIDTFGYDQMLPAEWEALDTAGKIAYWDSLEAGYDTAYVLLRNNNVVGNTVNVELIDDTWPGTAFVIDSDYNNIYPDEGAWTEGAHSKSTDPQFTDTPTIIGSSPLVGAGTGPNQYSTNRETDLYYFTDGADPYDLDAVGGYFNIGAAAEGPAYSDLVTSWHMPSFEIVTRIPQIPDRPDSVVMSEIGAEIKTRIFDAETGYIVNLAIQSPTAGGYYYSTTPAVTFAGVASSLIGSISQVVWASDKGQSGVATGTASWSFSADLFSGTSYFSITAINEYGDSLTVYLEVYGSVEKAVLTAVGIETGAPVVGVPELTALAPFGSFSRYLPSMTPDYAGDILSIAPHQVIQGRGSFKQVVHETDGGARSAITLSTTPRFYVTLKWAGLNREDFDALFGFYFNPARALGIARTFIWTHPVENTDYVVRFQTEFPFDYHAADNYAVSGITFRVLGVAA